MYVLNHNNYYKHGLFRTFMERSSLIQIIAVLVLGGLAVFYNPITADLQGKIIFFGIIVLIIIFFIITDLYKKIEQNAIKIKLFNDKMALSERIKKLENLTKK